MASTNIYDPLRERKLLETLDLRVAQASTNTKFQDVLDKYLAALLLKLDSPNQENRELTVRICSSIRSRLNLDQDVQLPITKLFERYNESQSPLVRRWTLLFVKQGLSRLPDQQKIDTLSIVLRSLIPTTNQFLHDEAARVVALEVLLGVLKIWRPPDRDSPEDSKLHISLGLDQVQSKTVAQLLVGFLLFSPQDNLGRRSSEQEIYATFFPRRPSIVPNLARLIYTSVFSDDDRFLPAVVLSVDANPVAEGMADAMFKHCEFDLESEVSVQQLLSLYTTAKTRLRTRVLTLLCRSRRASQEQEFLLTIVDEQLVLPTESLETTKLRAGVFQFLEWSIRMAEGLEEVAVPLQTSLKGFVESQGWPKPAEISPAELNFRAQAYNCIGSLAAKQRAIVDSLQDESRYNLVAWLFTSFRGETDRDVRRGIEHSLSLLMNMTVADAAILEEFETLLLWNVTAQKGDEDPIYYVPTVNAAQYLAVRFTNRIFPLNAVGARLIDLLALSSNHKEVVEEARRGLDPYWHQANSQASTTPAQSANTLPSYELFMRRVLDYAVGHERQTKLLNDIVAQEGLATFAVTLLANEAWQGSQYDISTQTDLTAYVLSTSGTSKQARELLSKQLCESSSTLTTSLLETLLSNGARGSLDCAKIAYLLLSLSSDDLTPKHKAIQQVILSGLTVPQTRDLMAKIAGIVLSLRSDWLNTVDQALERCSKWQTQVGLELAATEGYLLTGALVTSRAHLRGSLVPGNIVDRLKTLLLSILTSSTDQSLRTVAYRAVTQLSLCYVGSKADPNPYAEFYDIAMKDAKKENEAAVAAFGAVLYSNWTHLADDSRGTVLEQILDLHEIRKAEFQFRVGDAVTVAALGLNSSSMISDLDVVVHAGTDSVHSDLYLKLLDTLLSKSRTTKPALRLTCAIWLLCLLQYCQANELVETRLRDCQVAFGSLLNDRDSVVQEAASRGLSIVYEKGDSSLREALVRDLIESFTGTNARTSGTISEDTQLFEPGALPTENGQSVSTYKDIVSLAQEMGDPSLVYRFMSLASNNAIWNSRAAVGRFGLGGILADSTYLQQNKKFYPKLFRYRFDPIPNVRRSMEDIWKALVKDTNAVIEQNFDLIMSDLLKSILSGKDWRAREASCAAIADLLQGRDVNMYEKFLDEIWAAAFKVLDDVKETVRVAALALCRTLTNLLITNLEVGGGTTRRATVMLGHAMPFLLQQISSGSAKELQQNAIMTLLRVVDKAPPRSLQAFAPVMLETLITSLSVFEHEAINYVHLNADKYGLTTEKLDEMRVSSVQRSPLYEAIEKCLQSLSAGVLDASTTTSSQTDRDSKVPHLDEAMRRLEKCFKTTVGLPSRVGLSKVLVTLTTRYQVMFQPYSDRFVQRTRKSIIDRNPTISQSFSMALAYLLRLASNKEVQSTIAYVQQIYFESQEPAHRIVAGEMVQMINKCSNDVLLRHAPSLLPFAFIGRQDSEDDARKHFETAWKDNIGGTRAVHLYLKEICTLISQHIQSNLWPIKHACCFAVADLAQAMSVSSSYSANDAELVWSNVVVATDGKTWNGKERVIQAYPPFVRHVPGLWPRHGNQMNKIALREAKRNNAIYRPYAIKALGEYALARSDVDLSRDIVELLEGVVDEISNLDKMDVDTQDNEDNRCVMLTTDLEFC